jgi:membrane protease YdiL (CAAX protease family)
VTGPEVTGPDVSGQESDTIAGMAEAAAASSQSARAAGGRSKRRDLTEIAVAYALILLVIWTPRPWQNWLWWVAAAGILAMLYASFDGFAAMGLRRRGFWRSLWIAGAALLIAVIAVVVAAHLHTLRLPDGPLAFLGTYCAYSLWSAVQQFLLQSFFLLRFLRLIPGPRLAALATAILFALAHMPSAFLVPLTFVWGLLACLLFLHYRNLYPLALAHAILGITVAMTIPGPADHNMRVGLGYLRYGHHRHADRLYLLTQPSPKP